MSDGVAVESLATESETKAGGTPAPRRPKLFAFRGRLDRRLELSIAIGTSALLIIVYMTAPPLSVVATMRQSSVRSSRKSPESAL